MSHLICKTTDNLKKKNFKTTIKKKWREHLFIFEAKNSAISYDLEPRNTR